MLLKWEAGRQADRQTDNNQVWTSWTLIDGAFFSSIAEMLIERLCGRGAGGALLHPEYGVSEKRTETYSLILSAPSDLKTERHLCIVPCPRVSVEGHYGTWWQWAQYGAIGTLCWNWQLVDISRVKTDHCDTLTGFARWILYWLVHFDDFFWIVYVFEIANIYRFPCPVQQNDSNLK